MLANWNTGLQAIQPSIKHPDVVVMLVLLFAMVIDLVVEMVAAAETRRVVLTSCVAVGAMNAPRPRAGVARGGAGCLRVARARSLRRWSSPRRVPGIAGCRHAWRGSARSARYWAARGRRRMGIPQ